MARRRTPLAKAKATGQDKNHASRFKNRREPKAGGPLGDPPKWMKNKYQLEAWRTLSAEVPWLNSANRGLVGIASEILGKQMAGEELSVNALNLLRLTLGQLGATPVDCSKVALPDDEASSEDASSKYF
uniref:Terminase n=1 Tax=Bradyrhizobium barranii subsp. barranii TaxID=2823807 RepID=A0A7Z0TVY6_9BRAD